jgi:outer membrane protein OmpA-like peptidoglycan-associated protein
MIFVVWHLPFLHHPGVIILMVQRKKSGYHLLAGAMVCLILGMIIDIGGLIYLWPRLICPSKCESADSESSIELEQDKSPIGSIDNNLSTPMVKPSIHVKPIENSKPTTPITNCSPKTNGALTEENIKEPPYVEMSHKKVVRFATNQNLLSSKSTRTLETVVAHLKKHPKNRIRVEGYTDKSGSKKLNKRLSKERVEAVVSFLTKQGISLNRIELSGYGASRPLSCRKSRTAWAKNRRVELWIMKGH